MAPLNEPRYSLGQLAHYWDALYPNVHDNDGELKPPLWNRSPLERDGRYGDYRDLPWEHLLAGDPAHPPSLDLAGSQILTDDGELPQGVRIDRRWDVDSFLGMATSLAIHRDGVDLAYRPPYLRRISQNPQVTFRGCHLHHTKNLRFGRGMRSGGFNYECHVFFPNMPNRNKDSGHLNDDEQRVWIDELVIPSLRISCPSDVLQHHPRTFAEVDSKAKARGEVYLQGAKMAMDVRYCVPEENLDHLWAGIVERSNDPGHEAYQGVFLLISGHELKLFAKRPTASRAREHFLEHLDQCFNMTYLARNEAWLDLGAEDVPTDTDDRGGVTLLWKTGCLVHWTDLFRSPDHQRKLTQTVHYPWSLTRDAGSSTVKLSTTNRWNRAGGLAYHKAYNSHKELFATPHKGCEPFSLDTLQGLGYTQALLDRWYEASHRGGLNAHSEKREQLLQGYLLGKRRLAVALRDTSKCSFGVRQEYRIRLDRFVDLDLPSDDGAEAAEEGRHRPYLVLWTRELNAYLAGDVNRWLLCLEALMSQTQSGPGATRPARDEDLMANGVMVEAMLQTLRYCIGSLALARNPALGRLSWSVRARHGTAQHPASDDVRPPVHRLGLDYRRCLDDRGMTWLPRERVAWEGLPRFRREIISRLELGRAGFGQHLEGRRGVLDKLTEENRAFAQFRSMLEESRTDAMGNDQAAERQWMLELGAELVIQAYIRGIFEILHQRKQPSGRASLASSLQGLTEDQAAGLGGLTHGMVEAIMGQAPDLALVKKGARRGKSVLQPYQNERWGDRLRGLFAIDDSIIACRERVWDQAPFRMLYRRLRRQVQEVWDDAAVAEFVRVIDRTASQKLWSRCAIRHR